MKEIKSEIENELLPLFDIEVQRGIEQWDKRKNYWAKTIISGELVEVLLYELWPTGASNKGKSKLSSRTQQAELNIKRARQRCVRLMNANFTGYDSWITLGYTDESRPGSSEEADKMLRNYISRVKRRFPAITLKYIYSTEFGESHVHHHFVVNVPDRDTLEELWSPAMELARKRKNPGYIPAKYGRTQARRLQPDDFGLTGMAKYISKESRLNKKKFRVSKDLAQPLEKTSQNIKIDGKYKKLNTKTIKRLANDISAAKELMLKLHPDCQLNDIEVKQTGYSAGYYIYARMRRIA